MLAIGKVREANPKPTKALYKGAEHRDGHIWRRFNKNKKSGRPGTFGGHRGAAMGLLEPILDQDEAMSSYLGPSCADLDGIFGHMGDPKRWKKGRDKRSER